MASILFWLGFWLALVAGLAFMMGRFGFVTMFLSAGSGVGLMIAGMLLRTTV